ncbi:MAG: helix-turn-helix domain-containing protein [Chloroflexi bacterium]|nr:MAG: helix-turn-helix domain-containing protein [Chloroflexota bacterium]
MVLFDQSQDGIRTPWIVQRTTNAQRLVKRGHIILEAAKGMGNSRIAQHKQVDDETVRRWRDRWHAAEAPLQATEATGKPTGSPPVGMIQYS